MVVSSTFGKNRFLITLFDFSGKLFFDLNFSKINIVVYIPNFANPQFLCITRGSDRNLNQMHYDLCTN